MDPPAAPRDLAAAGRGSRVASRLARGLPAVAGVAAALLLGAGPSARDALAWKPEARVRFFLDNTEYFNELREGETLLGLNAAAYVAHDWGRLRLEAGGFAQRYSGSEEDLDWFIPWLRLRYGGERWELIGGALDSRDQYGLGDALSMSQRDILAPVEEGLQIRYRRGFFSEDLWLSWFKLNTEEQREFIAVGSRSTVGWGGWEGELAWRVSHHGGQLFDAGEPVGDNLAGRLSVGYWHPLGGGAGLGGRLAALAAFDRPDRSDETTHADGSGYEAAVFGRWRGLEARVAYFRGEDFIVELGNPIYRTGDPLVRGTVSYSLELGPSTLLLRAEAFHLEGKVEYAYGAYWEALFP